MVNKGYGGVLLSKITLAVDDIIEPFVLSPVGIFIGIALILQWHILEMPYVQARIRDWTATSKVVRKSLRIRGKVTAANPYSSVTARSFGMNMIVLQLYYYGASAKSANNNAFTFSCAWIFAETVVIWYLLQELGKFVARTWPARNKASNELPLNTRGSSNAVDDAEPEQAAGDNKQRITNVYMNISRPMRIVSMFYMAQIGLMLYYVYNLNIDPDTHNFSKVSGVKWVLGVIISIIAGEDEVGASYDLDYWERLMKAYTKYEKEHPDNKMKNVVCGCIPLIRIIEWNIRQFMDWSLNSVTRKILLFTAPIMLCVEDPLDFIKDVLAVFFIIKLDDYDDAKSFEDIKKDFTFRLPEPADDTERKQINSLLGALEEAVGQGFRPMDSFNVRG
jgi:hypothetical protein